MIKKYIFKDHTYHVTIYQECLDCFLLIWFGSFTNIVYFFRRISKDIPQKYIKAVYREYTDSTYTVPKPRPAWTGRSTDVFPDMCDLHFFKGTSISKSLDFPHIFWLTWVLKKKSLSIGCRYPRPGDRCAGWRQGGGPLQKPGLSALQHQPCGDHLLETVWRYSSVSTGLLLFFESDIFNLMHYITHCMLVSSVLFFVVRQWARPWLSILTHTHF